MAPDKAVPLLLEAIRALADPQGVTQAQFAKYVSRTRNVTLRRAALVAQRALRQGVTSGFVERRRKRYRLAAYPDVFDVESGDDAGEDADSGDDPPPEPAAVKDVVEAKRRNRKPAKRGRRRSKRSRSKRRGRGRGHSTRRRPFMPRRRRIIGDDE